MDENYWQNLDNYEMLKNRMGQKSSRNDSNKNSKFQNCFGKLIGLGLQRLQISIIASDYNCNVLLKSESEYKNRISKLNLINHVKCWDTK